MLAPHPTTFDPSFVQTLVILFTQIRIRNGMEQSHAIILCENDTADLANALIISLFASTSISTHFIVLNSEIMFDNDSNFEQLNQLHEDCIVIALFEHFVLYLDLVAAFTKLAVIQTILISREIQKSALHLLGAKFTLAPRLLLVTPRSTNQLPESLQSLNFHVWSIERPTVAVPLTHGDLFASYRNPAAALFWNDVRRLDGPLAFRDDLVPTVHIRQCPDGHRCFAFGLYVMMANMLATYLHTVAEIEFKRSFITKYYETSPYRSDFARYANLRDGLLTFNAHDSVIIVNPVKAVRFGHPDHAQRNGTSFFAVQDTVFIVPYRRRTSKCGAAVQMLEQRLVFVACWIMLVVMISFLRYADSERREFAAIMLNTWAQSTGNGTKLLYASTLSQRIAVGGLGTFAILWGSIFSGEMYQNSFSCPPPRQIDTTEVFYTNTDLPMFLPIESFPTFVK